MPRKPKEITHLLNKINTGKATAWEIKHFGGVCRRFLETDEYEILRSAVESAINKSLDKLNFDGNNIGSSDFREGFRFGCRMLMRYLDDQVNKAEIISQAERKERKLKKATDEESDIPEEFTRPDDASELI